MLKIKDKLPKKAAETVQFTSPSTVQKLGIEMLITLNLTERAYLIGPDVGKDLRILVTKIKPHFFFNPIGLTSDSKDSIIQISFKNYLGNDKSIELDDISGNITVAIDYLNNGTKKAK